MSRLKVARIKKLAIENGNEWPFDVPAKNKPVVFKGQKHLIRQAKRYIFRALSCVFVPLLRNAVPYLRFDLIFTFYLAFTPTDIRTLLPR